MSLNPPLRDWSGRLAWVVGASSGIGRATAAALQARGARVLVSARRGEVLDEFVRQHPGTEALPLDVCDPAAVAAAAVRVRERAAATAGGLALTLYCAGHYQPLRATQFDLGEMLRHQDINQTGALRVLDAVLPLLLAQGQGHVSLVASVAGYRGLPRALAYGPTKAALINLAQVLYLDLHPRGLGVSIVNPGFVDTRLTAQNDFTMPALQRPEQAAEAMLRGWAEGRFEIHFPRRFTGLLKALRLLGDRSYFAAVRRATGG